MEREQINLYNYTDLLKELENEECHLLLGNGFNLGLGIHTNYISIFQEMIKSDFGIYKEAENLIIDSHYDLEVFIGKLIDDINIENSFLIKYVQNKVKYDFMKAAYGIVKRGIKDIYAEKNEGIFLLLKNFSNFFTLNYDSFLYLLLLNFKLNDNDDESTIAFQPTFKFLEQELDESFNKIYSEIKQARKNGTLKINAGDDSSAVIKHMRELPKIHFVAEIKAYSKSNNKNWKSKDITRVVDYILEEETKNKVLEIVDDGFQLQLFDDSKEYVFDIESETQNLFFLHGAFHIYQDGKEIKKITQTSDKALYDRLEDIINSEDRDIICIFQAENKIGEINKSENLKKALNKLSELSGTIVIIGCSLSENDNHIYEQINNSKVNTIYISSKEKSKTKDYEKAKNLFKDKVVILFDRNTVSYKLPTLEDKNE